MNASRSLNREGESQSSVFEVKYTQYTRFVGGVLRRIAPSQGAFHCRLLILGFPRTMKCALDRIGLEQLSPQQPVTCQSFFRLSPA